LDHPVVNSYFYHQSRTRSEAGQSINSSNGLNSHSPNSENLHYANELGWDEVVTMVAKLGELLSLL